MLKISHVLQVTWEELFQGETEHFKPEAAALGADHRLLQSQVTTDILTALSTVSSLYYRMVWLKENLKVISFQLPVISKNTSH